MFTMILTLIILCCLFGLAFKLTGALLKACLWLIFLLPFGGIIIIFGLLCCCTLILIPVGITIIKAGMRILIPVG